MTVEELEKLKTGDIVRSSNIELVVRVNPEDKHRWKYWEFTCNEDSCLDVCIVAVYNNVRDADLEKIKDWKVVDAEYKLSLDIKKKETELENLKKELVELTRKKMLDQIVPDNIYRIYYGENNSVVGFLNKIDDQFYSIKNQFTTIHHIDVSTISSVILMKDVTEAYKNFKTILEKA